MRTFGTRSQAALVGVDPGLVRVASVALIASPFDFGVTEGLRSIERQRILFARGDSDTMHSKHLPNARGLSEAIDVMAVGDLNRDGYTDAQDKTLTWDNDIYSAIAEAFRQASVALDIKIRWGGTFKRRNGEPFFDGPHFELVLP